MIYSKVEVEFLNKERGIKVENGTDLGFAISNSSTHHSL